MDPVRKALWYIESRLRDDLTLEGIAAVAGVSRYHLVRAFGMATGRSVMRYVRGRRLSGAAQGLAAGAPDILSLALDAGYGSHEAFTRAFRDQFRMTPERARAEGHPCPLQLVEPIILDGRLNTTLASPRFVDSPELLLAGISEHYSYETSANIPAQWQRFGGWADAFTGPGSGVAYGVVYNADDEGRFDYLAGISVKDFSRLTATEARLRLAPQRYAVFASADHVSQIRPVCHAIWRDWLPNSGLQAADAPFFELYPDAFDPLTGTGGFEVWLPVQS